MEPDERALVLLVLDNDDEARRIGGLLTSEGGPEVVRVRTIGEAGGCLAREPDCVLLAQEWGAADPHGAVDDIARFAPEAALIVLTTDPVGQRSLAGTGAGAQDWLVLGELDRRSLERAVRYAIERARALRTLRHLQENDVRAAEKGRLERGLLPRPLLHDEHLRCVTLYQPGVDQALLGGDFYDLVELDDGTVLALVGDVAGRGADQAVLGIRLRVAWRTLALARLDQVDTFGALEELLVSERHDTELFVTACEVVVAADRSRAFLRSAGHPVPLVCSAHVVEIVSIRVGPPLGVAAPGSWAVTELDLAGVDALVLVTDGLVVGFAEATSRERLGIEGVRDVIEEERAHSHDLGDVIGGALEAVQRRNGGLLPDDVAILAIGFGEPPWPGDPEEV